MKKKTSPRAQRVVSILRDSDIEKLALYIIQQGRGWKAAMRTAWMQGTNNMPWMQNLRNTPSFGPLGLQHVSSDAILDRYDILLKERSEVPVPDEVYRQGFRAAQGLIAVNYNFLNGVGRLAAEYRRGMGDGYKSCAKSVLQGARERRRNVTLLEAAKQNGTLIITRVGD